MKKQKNEQYVIEIIERMRLIMQLSNLEILGFAMFTGLSESHIYSMLSGRRALTNDVAAVIGNKLGFDGTIIFNLNQDIPESIRKSEELNNFRLKYKDNPEYFIDTKLDRKPAYFLEFEVLSTSLFKEPKYVWEVNEFCKKLGKKFISDKLKKYLKYFVTQGKLKSEKRPIKLRNGSYGSRMVDVFFYSSDFLKSQK